jgi:competence protein ComEC
VPIVDVNDLPPEEIQLRCDAAGCVYRHGNQILATPIMDSAALEDCERADTVIAPFVIHDCGAKHVTDEPDFWHRGAHAIFFDGDRIRINYVHDRRGERPWSIGWKGQKDED